MEHEVLVSATTVEDALETALEQLQAPREDVDFEILEEPAKKLFGGTTQARLRVWLVGEALENEDDEASEDEDALEGDPVDKDDDESGADTGDEDANNAGGAGGATDDADDDESGEETVDADDDRNYSDNTRELTEEELDTIADTAIETIRELLTFFGIENAEIDEYEGEEGELILDIVGDNLAMLIGRHGKNLDSLQFIVSSIVTKKTGLRYPVVIDIEGYKHRRKQKLISIAKASAARVIRQKREVHLRPMTPYERRIVHITLRGDRRVVTSSEGVEPNRSIVIRLA
jgi:spoIIIJ-associated protein